MLHKETLQSPLKSGLTPQQRQEMRLWLLSNGKKGVAHHNVLYSRYDPENLKKNGHNAFLAFSQTELYKKHIGSAEEKLIEKHSHLIAESIPDRCNELVEMGPGNQKITKYFKKIYLSAERKEQIQYRPADVAKSAIDDGYADAQKMGFKKGGALLGDWDDPTTFSHVQDAFYVCFGGGFVNGYDGISQRINNMQGSGYVQRGRVFSTFFGMPGDDSMGENDKVLLLKAMYGDRGTDLQKNPFTDQESYDKARDMVLQPFEALGFDIDKLDFGVEREAGEPPKIVLGARVTKPFTEREGDETYTYATGDFIPLIDSPRPTLEQYTKKVVVGGGNVLDSFSVDGAVGTITALPRKKFSHKVKKRARNIAGTLVGGALLLWGAHEYGKYSKLSDARDYALQEISFRNIEHPLKTFYQRGELLVEGNTNYNATTETRAERLAYITNNIYDIAITEYKEYDFPDEDIVKAAIMRSLPEYTEYFTHNKGPDEHFFAFVNHVLMPHLFASFGNQNHVGIYSRMQNEEELLPLLEKARTSTGCFFIEKLKSDIITNKTFWSKGMHDVEELGFVYIPTNDGVYRKIKLGYVTEYKDVTMGNGRGVNLGKTQVNKFLIAGDDESGYSEEQARRVVEFVDEKGYAGLLTDEIMQMLDPTKMSADHYGFTKKLYQYIVTLNRQGYDLSWLCRSGKEKELQRFVGGFLLAEGSPVCHEIYSIVAESGVSLENTKNLSVQLTTLMDFLHTYYGQKIVFENYLSAKNDVGARNFLMQVLLSNYFGKKDITKLSPTDIFTLLQRLGDNLRIYGYPVHLQEAHIYKRFEVFFDDYTSEKKTEFEKILFGEDAYTGSLEELYNGQIIFTSDGRGWLVIHRDYPIAVELTKENCYVTMKAKLPLLLEQKAQEDYKKSYASLGSFDQRMVSESVFHELGHTVLKKNLDNAYHMAKDFHHHTPH